MEFGFFLKKFITFFVEPLGLILFMLSVATYFLYAKKQSLSRVFLSFGFGLLLLFSYPPFANFLVSSLENNYPKYNYESDVKYIHVLGSGHNDDNSQPLSSKIGGAGLKRVLEGVIIHKRTPNSKLIFTGYASHMSISTAMINTQLAIALGVKKEDIITEEKPKDTKEEAEFIKSLLGDEPFILITSATHLTRSMMLFKSLNLNPIPAPTAFYKIKIDGYLYAPNAHSLYKSKVAIHEYIGILWSIFVW